MKISLIVSILLVFTYSLNANWDDAFKSSSDENKNSKTQQNNKNSKKEKLKSDGLDIDITDRLETSSKGEWFEKIKPDAKPQKGEKEPKILKDLIQALNNLEALMPDNMPEKGIMLNQVAQGFYTLGDFERGEKLSLRALRITEKFKGPESIETFYCLRTMALMYETLGEFERAQKTMQECFKIIEKNKKIDRGFYPSLYANLSRFNIALDDIAEAEKNADLALNAARSRTDGVGLDVALLAKAACCKVKGEYAPAQKFFEEAVVVIEKQYKEDVKKSGRSENGNGSLLAYARLSLLELYISQSEVEKAQMILPETEEIFKKEYHDVMNSETSKFLTAKIIFSHLRNDKTSADRMTQSLIDYQNNTLPAALEMVEKQRLGWQKQNLSLSIPVAFSNPEVLANCILSWKGIVLDSLITDRKNLKLQGSSKDSALMVELASLKKQLSQIKLTTSGQKDEDYVKYLENKIYAKEMQISKASKSNYYSKEIPNLKSVQDKLNEEDVLLEYVSYRSLPDIYLGPKKIGVIVIYKNHPPEWFNLGDQKDIDDKVKHFQLLLAAQNTTDSEIENLMRDLHKTLIPESLNFRNKKVKNLFISPDGILNFIPFSCLLDIDNHFLAESLNIYFVGSGRDLLKNPAMISKKNLSLFANPVFKLEKNEPVLNASSQNRINNYMEGISLPPLPGTESEARRIEDIAKKSGYTCDTSLGISATEDKVTSIKGPSILHFATHGFFLRNKQQITHNSGDRGMSVKDSTNSELEAKNNLSELDPMHSSGIAFSGAENTFAMWSIGNAPDPSTDGILTAEEVTSLDLNGTNLVTLSACESGVGEAKSGEGVFGLRRSFMMAGAQNLLMTLWPVDDITTADLMVDFYSQLFIDGKVRQSLASTQREWLLKLRQTNGILDSIRKAGPFVLATTGNTHLN